MLEQYQNVTKYGIEPFVSMKCGNILNKQSDCHDSVVKHQCQ